MKQNFVFSTERYEEEAKKYSASEELQKFREKLIDDPNYEPKSYESFPGNYYKIRHENLRIILVGRDLFIEGNQCRVYVALRFMKRDSSEYNKFKFSMTKPKDRDSITGIGNLDWDSFKEQIKEQINRPEEIVEKPELSEEEIVFISSSLNINHDLFGLAVIYETKEWIDDIQNVGFLDFSNAATEIESFIYDNLLSENGWYTIEFKEKALLLYHNFINEDENDWVLCRILQKKDNGEYDEYMKQKPMDFHRGYPYTFLKDKDDWRIMELDKKSNMVLSKQQVGIVSGEKEYPIFLTGRAGSGKSTVLQYMFAEVILKYLISRDEHANNLNLPVYLSYSSNLIDDAKKLCITLFEKNNVYKDEIAKYHIQYKNDISPILDKMFFVFSKLLRACIDKRIPGESEKLFPENNDSYISFPKFRSMWEKKFGRGYSGGEIYGPSICWHVIRTYIKGWNAEHYMTPEEYMCIGNKNQTVSYETFKSIYNIVWENWYYKLNNVWDDQDLVRHCLENNLIDDSFSAVFCDESQDFTRVEIDFILKCSSFSNRKIQNIEDIKRLPFVFAGDEFQTLNPTGFSWESLRSYFTEKLCEFTGLSDKINELRIPDPIELSENFRSTKQIVKLANRVQLLRASRFGEYSKPQKPHFSNEGNYIYCVKPNDKFNFEKMKQKQVILIIPAADGESIESFINNTPLKGQISFDKKGVPQEITILNPTQAKGLEYPNVAVFGFQANKEYESLSIKKLLEWFYKPTEDSIGDIDLKYQVSNAYVAVTRASSNLYIIDDFNDSSFWSFAFNHEDPILERLIKGLQEDMIKSLSNSRKQYWNEEELGWIDYIPDLDITDENLSYLRSEEHKNDLENRAEALHDPILMRRAACIHKGAGNKEDEARCKAKALNYEEDYLGAAEEFEIAKMYDDAVENYWLELSRKEDKSLINKISRLQDYTHNQKMKLCVQCSNMNFREFKIAVNDTLKYFSERNEDLSKINAWQYVLNYMLKLIMNKKEKGAKELPMVIESCAKLNFHDINISNLNLGFLAYNMGDLDNAIKLWETIDRNQRPQNYFIAKIKTVSYPESIEFYEGTKDPNWKENLLSAYRKNKDVKLNVIQKRIMVNVIRSSKNTNEEYKSFLPFILRNAISIENSMVVINEAEKYNIALNKPLYRALFEARFGSDLQSWNKPVEKFIDKEANLLFDAIEAIKEMKSENFIPQMNDILKVQKVKDYCYEKYRSFSRKNVTKLILTELGRIFETRGIFVDALRYYEWAKNQSDDSNFKRAVDIRMIACKERKLQLDYDENLKQEVLDARRALLIPADEKLPELPLLSADDWEELFEKYITTGSEVRIRRQRIKEPTAPQPVQKTGQTTNSGTEGVQSKPEKPDEIKPSAKKLSTKKQKIDYENYSIVLFPDKCDLVIRNNDKEFSVRIKNGKFPSEADFYIKDGRIYQTEDDLITPFVIEESDNYVTLKVFDGDDSTGLFIGAEKIKN